VFKRITDMNQSGNHEAIRNEKDPFRAISLFLEFRTQFIIKYYNILEFLKNFNPRQIPVELQPIFSNLQKRELKTLTTIIEKGVEAGLFKIDDVKAVAELFFDMLDGFRQKSLSKVNFFPEKKQFQSVLKREKEFAAIFFKGLTK
ncbi:MAG TPA: TetR family transcriptional regulator C-terminal domain-containing protein, partial [Parasegetibacter sp.]